MLPSLKLEKYTVIENNIFVIYVTVPQVGKYTVIKNNVFVICVTFPQVEIV